MARRAWWADRDLAILTTIPNAITVAVHDRMPVILDPGSYDRWLDPRMTNVSAVSDLLKPFDARFMCSYSVDVRFRYFKPSSPS